MNSEHIHTYSISPEEILTEAGSLQDSMVSWRREIHRHPEIGLHLPATAAVVSRELTAMGLTPMPCGSEGTTGIVALIEGAKPGPVLMLRADMDALPLHEDNPLDYKSEIPGAAHMCGHDTHTAMLLGAARILTRHKDRLCGTIKLMFQPGEEGYNGASHMIADGLLENPRVDAALAMHCLTGSKWNTGTLLCATGLKAKASADEFKVEVCGSGTHGATPEHGTDVVYALTRILEGLYGIRSRELSPFTPAILSVCQIEAGHAANILPGSGFLRGTFRTFDPEVRAFIRSRITEIAEQTALACRTEARVSFSGGLAPTINDAELCPAIFTYMKELVGEQQVDVIGPVTGAEDFSEVSARIPTTYIDLSFGSADQGYPYAVHSPKCVFDEDAMPIGAACHAWCAMRYLEEHC